MFVLKLYIKILKLFIFNDSHQISLINKIFQLLFIVLFLVLFCAESEALKQ